MFIIKYKKIWYLLSIFLLIVSLLVMSFRGFNLSIDFTGGTIMEISYENRPVKELLESKIGQSGTSVRTSGENNYVIRTKEPIKVNLGGEVIRENTIGPVAGAELASKARIAMGVVIIMIVLFVTFAFRKVSKPVSSWKYGLVTIIALAHDVIIPTGFFVFLGKEIDLLFITGLLAILGYSVHDTIVVFDRIRENLHLSANEPFEEIVGRSVNQTFARSINTSLTIFITLLALYLLGSTATQNFSLLLIIGLIAGTYSSIFVASPLLVTFFSLQSKKGQV